LLLTVRTHVASTIHVRVNNSWSPSTMADGRRRRSDKAGTSNAWCNSRAQSQRKPPFTCSSDRFACLDVASVIRRTCTKCEDAGLMTPSKSSQCREITRKNVNIDKGVKIYCNKDIANTNNDYHRHKSAYERANCAFLSVTRFTRAPTWSVWGPGQICPCVNKFVDDCKQPPNSNKPWKYGLSCMLEKIEQCPKVCPELKSRIKSAIESSETASLMEAKVENELKDRASVLVDAHGKTSRNASASILSLDHSMSGKCSQ